MAGEQSRAPGMDVLLEVVEAYCAVVVAQEQQRVTEESYRTAQADLDRAQSLHGAGMTTDADGLALRSKRR